MTQDRYDVVLILGDGDSVVLGDFSTLYAAAMFAFARAENASETATGIKVMVEDSEELVLRLPLRENRDQKRR